MRRTIPVEQWPRGRTVVAIRFDDVASPVSRWWICVTGDEVDVCDVDPGFEVTATVRTSLRSMTEIWRGDRGWGDAMRSGRVEVEAPTEVARAVPTWIGQSLLVGGAAPGVTGPGARMPGGRACRWSPLAWASTTWKG